jgi:RNA polymerase sigma-70 factor, ECF subfamily
MNSEADLLQRARNGDRTAGEELFLKYLEGSKSVMGLLRRGLSNPQDREEMLHEIYLQLISGQNSFRGEAQLATYVYQVARITLLQKYRKENTLKRGKIYRTISDPIDIPDQATNNPEYTYSVKEAREILKEMIGRLPETYREVMTLRVVEDFSYEEIARKLNIPLNTVSTKIYKGKKILAGFLKDKGFAEVSDF